MIVFVLSLLLKAVLCSLSLIFLGIIAEKIRSVLANIVCTCRVNLSGKVVLVTGGDSGIGFETAKILVNRGARVIIAGHNVGQLQAAVQAIIEATGNPNVECKPLDLSRFSSIEQFANDFNRSYDRLNVLIHNTGIFQRQRSFTEDGIERLMQINHLGPTYLTKLLLDKLTASKPSRIIFVTSMVHKSQDFDPDDVKGVRTLGCWTRYANAKLANILIARALSKILPEGVTANSLHPGTPAINIFSCVPEMVKKPMLFLFGCLFKTVEECAQTSVHLAMAPALAYVSGGYFDECSITKTDKVVTDELAEQFWKKTISLIEDKSNYI